MTFTTDNQPTVIPIFGVARSPSTPAKQAPPATISGLLQRLSLFAGMFSVALTLLSAYGLYQIRAALGTWTKVQAEVISSEIYSRQVHFTNSHQAGQLSTVYGFRAGVAYSAGQHSYRSQADIGYQKGNRGDMLRWSNRYHPGNRILIAYDPSDPNHVRFADDIAAAYALPLGMIKLATFFLAACIALLMTSRKMQSA